MKKFHISKLILFILISICNFSSYSQNRIVEFNLKCKVKVEYSHSNGYKTNNNSDLIVNVFEDKVNKFTNIILKSSNEDIYSISVTTQQTSQQQKI